MNIRGRAVLSFGGLSLTVGALLVACGSSSSSSAPPGESGPGQSCTQTSDCKSGQNLECLSNVCIVAATTTSPTSDASAAAGDAGDAAVSAATGPHLGLVGEACQTTKDCSTGLDCVASEFGTVCEAVSYGLTPTGNTCSGECSTATDCCELPLDIELAYLTDASAFAQDVAVHSCQDVLTALGGSANVCTNGAVLNTYQKTACFYYETYCNCAAGTWACSTNHQCQYAAPCTEVAVNTLGGCPSQNRVGASGESTCTIPTGTSQGSCLPSNSCTATSDCNGKAVADVDGATCADNDCTCYQSGCYLTCQGNLDCAAGSTCDTATSLCKTAGCTTSADCVTTTNNTTAQCLSGACKIPCSTDYQCNGGATGSAPTTFNGQICSSGYCTPLGCSSNSDCSSGDVQLFCVTPPATGEHSAITGGMM
jgi:hypothetical protein